MGQGIPVKGKLPQIAVGRGSYQIHESGESTKRRRKAHQRQSYDMRLEEIDNNQYDTASVSGSKPLRKDLVIMSGNKPVMSVAGSQSQSLRNSSYLRMQ